MKLFFKIFVLFLVISCGSKEARRPVMVKTNTFLKESAQKNKILLKKQEILIDSVIKLDTINHYVTSKDGFKYYYITEEFSQDYTPKFGDKVTFEYRFVDIFGKEALSENQTKTYYVEKEELFLGLRSAIKILKQGQEAVFFFPSEIAFGYHGDKKNIGINEPIQARVKIISVEKEEEKPSENASEDQKSE